jgi:4-hydroxy-3-methylbut-2-en-1-yl diphosphate reductase
LENKDKLKKIAVILQTTEIIYNVKDIVAELVLFVSEMKFLNTICTPSRIKQDEVIRLAKENDVTYIVGSPTSKNTKNLYYLAQKYSNKVFFIQEKSMINLNDLKDVTSVAVAAGTSTPDNITNEIIVYLESLQKDTSFS